MEKEIIIIPSAENLIESAITKGVTVDIIERLLNMRRTLQSEAAERAFREAMSGFQSEMPIVIKRKEVKDRTGKYRYSFASMDDIIRTAQPYLAKYGLSYDINTEAMRGPDQIVVTVTANHIAGHSKPTQFMVPIDADSYMSDPQKWAAAQTFAKRYAFCNVFGILTGDEDNDAGGTREKELEADKKEQKKAEAIAKINSLSDNVKDGFHAIGYTGGQVFYLCEKMGWDESKIIIEINKILTVKESREEAKK